MTNPTKADVPLLLTSNEQTYLAAMLDEMGPTPERDSLISKVAAAQPVKGTLPTLDKDMLPLIAEYMRRLEPCQTNHGTYDIYRRLKVLLEVYEAAYAAPSVPQCGENPLEDTIYG